MNKKPIIIIITFAFLISTIIRLIIIHDDLTTFDNIYVNEKEFKVPAICNESNNYEQCIKKAKKQFQKVKNAEYRIENYKSIENATSIIFMIIGIGCIPLVIVKKERKFKGDKLWQKKKKKN